MGEKQEERRWRGIEEEENKRMAIGRKKESERGRKGEREEGRKEGRKKLSFSLV
jgi:hypothetical protein